MNAFEHERPDLAGLSPWAPELARTFVSLASDIALVIDGAGTILSVVQKPSEAVSPSAADWVGQQWVDTVTGETRTKIEKLLKEVVSTGSARRREVGHPIHEGDVVPIAYTAVRLGEHGPVLAVGRDLRTIAAIQRRFIESQQDLERDYWRARQAEARYRLLFQVATDGVMVVDPETCEIVEANRAAAQLFAGSGGELVGKQVTAGFDHYSRAAVSELVTKARSSEDSGEIRARLLGTTLATNVAATPFRSDNAMRLLVRVRTSDAKNESTDVSADIARLVDDIQDGVVVTDSSGLVLMANPAFLRLFGIDDESSAKGRPLAGWLRATTSSMTAVIAHVRRDGIARGFEFEIAAHDSGKQSVEVSAALLTDDDQERIGFTIRKSSVAAAGRVGKIALQPAFLVDLGIVAGQLGVLPMSALMSEAARLVEQQLIALALQHTGGDQTAAALLLGVSRERVGQSERHAGTP